MSHEISFLFDENVPPMFYIQLINLEPAITTFSIGDGIAPPTGTLDPEILIWIEEKGCLLVTNNRASMASTSARSFKPETPDTWYYSTSQTA